MPMGGMTVGGEDGGFGQLPLLPVYPPGPHAGGKGGGGGGGGGLKLIAEAVGIVLDTNNAPTNTMPAITLRQCFMDSLLWSGA